MTIRRIGDTIVDISNFPRVIDKVMLILRDLCFVRHHDIAPHITVLLEPLFLTFLLSSI